MSAMRIPIYENQVSQEQGTPLSVPNLATPPENAFGTGLAQATVKTGEVMGGIGAQLADHMIERQRMMQHAQVVQGDTQAITKLQDAMGSTKPIQAKDENGQPKVDANGQPVMIPEGVWARKGLDAVGATKDFDAAYQNIRQETVNSMSTPYMKMEIGQLFDERFPRLRERVITHEATQTQAGVNSIYQQGLAAQVSLAPTFSNDPQGLVAEIGKAHERQYANAVSNGDVEHGNFEAIQKAHDNIAHDMVMGAVSPIGTSPDAALRYLDSVNANKGTLSPQVYGKLKEEIGTTARQNENLQKYQQAQMFDANMNKYTHALVEGKLNSWMVEKAYMNGEINHSDLHVLTGELNNPAYKVDGTRSHKTDVSQYNEIRRSMFDDSKTPGELTRMVAAAPNITRTDKSSLLNLITGMPPSPRDKDIESNANAIKDFASKLPAGGWFERTLNKDTVNPDDFLTKDFFDRVDTGKLAGEDIQKAKDDVISQYLKKSTPGLNNIKGAADTIIRANGMVQRTLSPSEAPRAKADFVITRPKAKQGSGQ
jgi:hypothetical protein